VREIAFWLDEGGADDEVNKNRGRGWGERALFLHAPIARCCIPTSVVVVLGLHGAIFIRLHANMSL